ncbi:hypothetical protein WN944_009214 [Citrus x changshan-huyou]|uniref:Pentatricopeptide repeat-containing protein n=1 Tax=Citrus x changshan-huyou TaxID=2935761 RepID=A0AAP0MRT6_9ROSI
MYAACKEIDFAKAVFEEMPVRDVVSWSSMIAGFVPCDSPSDALKVFHRMKLANENPNSVTVVSLVSACTSLINVRAGESIHSYAVVNGLELDVALGTALVEMYSKCGHVERAFKVFNLMREKNLQSWTIMISGLADNGRGNDAISLFDKMIQTGLKPDSISFSAILSACSHLGLVDEGKNYFDEMARVYNIKPTMEHYGCMVDMLGKAGLIEEETTGQVLCLDDNLGKLLLKLEPELGANYVLAASVSSLSGNWDTAAELMVAINQKGLNKVPGCSWVKVNDGSAEEMSKETAA